MTRRIHSIRVLFARTPKKSGFPAQANENRCNKGK
jgi:hypothetical protein